MFYIDHKNVGTHQNIATNKLISTAVIIIIQGLH